MTSGSVSYDHRVPATGGGWWGVYYSRVHNGQDRTRLPKPAHNYYETYREYTDFAGVVHRKDIKIRIPHPSASGDNRVVRRKWDEEHDYQLTMMRMFEDKVSYTVPSNFAQWSDMTQHGVQDWTAENLVTANDRIKLINRFQEMMYGSDFNMGVVLGELGETLGLIGDTAGRLGGALGAARKGKFGLAADFLLYGTKRAKKEGHVDLPKSKITPKMLADNWLELQYGWLPLLKDVEAGAQMLAHHLNVPMRQSYRTSTRKEKVVTRVSQVGYLPTQTAVGYASKTHRLQYIARIQEHEESIPQLLGLTAPELVAWELLPYSFVADWFIPLGDWMAARALVRKLRGTFITSEKWTANAYTPTSDYFAFQPRGNYSQVLFGRTVSTTLDVPMPRIKSLGQVAAWQHCANAIGLLVSGYAGRRD